jgi:hypothetical protein
LHWPSGHHKPPQGSISKLGNYWSVFWLKHFGSIEHLDLTGKSCSEVPLSK